MNTLSRNPECLWTPTQAESCQLSDFIGWLATTQGINHANYASLHRWSVDHCEQFWRLWAEYADLIAFSRGAIDRQGELSAQNPAQFFPDSTISLVANCLRRRGDRDAIVYVNEAGQRHHLSHDQLYEAVARATTFLQHHGVQAGDRVAGVIANCPEAVIFCLAAAALGACWTACSPDFGADGILDRFRQIEPKVLIATLTTAYGGKGFDLRVKLAQVIPALPTLTAVVTISGIAPTTAATGSSRTNISLNSDFSGVAIFTAEQVQQYPPACSATLFQQHRFNIPLFILYSSGTTGQPKCIVHGAGGLLLKLSQEHRLHLDIRAGDRVFYFTTCGWMMWNWLVFALASQATIVLYEGSPLYPNPNALWQAIDDVTFFGSSAKYFSTLQQRGMTLHQPLPQLRTIASTGSPLSPESFRWIYQTIKNDIHLASISGGTDICSCFLSGVPTEPVYAGELQAPCLGIDLAIVNEQGAVVDIGTGELTVNSVFPTMPLGFWRDSDRHQYHRAYFDAIAGRWVHGDLVEKTATGYAIVGRSDTTLNPSGVRIGTAEIYRHLETIAEIDDALAVSLETEPTVRLVLFVVLSDHQPLEPTLIQTIKACLKQRASPHHVPDLIVSVTSLPYTRSGKLAELAVKQVLHGRTVNNKTALINPEALDQFVRMPEIVQAFAPSSTRQHQP